MSDDDHPCLPQIFVASRMVAVPVRIDQKAYGAI